MAKLDFIERDYFERLFGMSTGYVLDFSNRTFQEFVHSVMDIDIYKEYPGLSKAKILRAIIYDYNDVTVGKLLLELLRYMQAKKMVVDGDKEVFRECFRIGNRLIGKTVKVKTPTQDKTKGQVEKTINYDGFLNRLKGLTDLPATPQARGFAFEEYLYDLFQVFGMEPRGSFKVVGEQIDGSFILYNQVYLLEAKWTNKAIGKSDLVVFNEKVSSKSGFTRGLYISFSGYTSGALASLSNGRVVKTVLMTVAELAIVLSQQRDLADVLWSKVRALAEEGDFNKSVLEI